MENQQVTPIFDASKIETVNPLPPVPTQANTPAVNYDSLVNSSQNYLDSVQEAERLAQEARIRAANQQQSINNLSSQIGGRSAEQFQEYETSGVNSLAARIRRLNAELSGVAIANQQAPLRVLDEAQRAGRTMTERIAAGQTEAERRQNALRALDIQAQTAVAVADFETAKSLVDQKIETKYAQLKTDLEIKKSQLEFLQNFDLTPAQERAAEARRRAYAKEDIELKRQMDNEKLAEDLIINASQQGASQDLIARASQIRNRGGKPAEVAAVLGVYAGDYRKAQLLEEQIKTEKAQRAKIFASMPPQSQNTGALGAIKTAADLQNVTSKLKLNEGQGKSLAFAQRAINADTALRARLETYDPTTIFSATGRLLETNNAKAFRRDMNDFITAVLRKESGATITPDEFEIFIPLYSPQGIMTNSEDVIQTNLKRAAAIDAIISEAGEAAPALVQYKNAMEGKINTKSFSGVKESDVNAAINSFRANWTRINNNSLVDYDSYLNSFK